MFLDQGELDGPQIVENIPQGSDTLSGAEVEGDKAGKKFGKRGIVILVVLLVVIVSGLGYFLLIFGKGSSNASVPALTTPGPSSAQVSTTTTQAAFAYNATKNPFVPVGSPGVNVGSSSSSTSASTTTTTSAAG